MLLNTGLSGSWVWWVGILHLDIRGGYDKQKPHDNSPHHWLFMLHMLPHLAKLPQSLRLVHVGITAHFHLFPGYSASINLSIRMDYWIWNVVPSKSLRRITGLLWIFRSCDINWKDKGWTAYVQSRRLCCLLLVLLLGSNTTIRIWYHAEGPRRLYQRFVCRYPPFGHVSKR